jgi:DNA polymerase-3 subunit delta
MPEINYKDIKKYLKDVKNNKFAPVYLIFGDEYLYGKAFDELLDAMLPGSDREFNHEAVDPDEGNVVSGIESLNTFSFLSGIKVVSFRDSKVFYSKTDDVKLLGMLEKAKGEYEKNDMKKAAKQLASLLSILNLSFDDIKRETRDKTLKLTSDILSDDQWLDKLISYCKDTNRQIPSALDSANLLEKAIKKGFPKGNHLIITTDLIDKRRALYKAIKGAGITIDCFVPKGERWADKKVQDSVLRESMKMILEQSGKRIDEQAYQELCNITGFDLRTFSNNLEKLIVYIGKRDAITVDDVKSVLKRTKSDKIYELTNAISEKKIDKALFYLNSIIKGGIHPLAVLGAIINQIRKILVVKEFTQSPIGSAWHAGISYDHFRNSTLPALKDYDKNLLNQLEKWEKIFKEANGSTGQKKKTNKQDTDLLIAKNPNNPYPIYQTFLKSELFTKEELLSILERLGNADLAFKTTGKNPKLILEDIIINSCQKR